MQDLTEALTAASYADRTEHAKKIRLRAQFQPEAARRWGLAPAHDSYLFSRDLELDPHTILPKAWFTDVLDNFLPDLESSHYPMVEGKEVMTGKWGCLVIGPRGGRMLGLHRPGTR